ncbi:T9SS type A sorting domain-containing protein [candidate division WOR-3 bacterium]|uniref:T9SS type A sorting domain-containing protein n=1 Tax=candidate division WOR-3 bacterium TaxID=2052148 RepID=A0A937XJM6_UNCW3|nr:T9SS type A sorting domain-containing protein [candidate division WOR-3 bacterium]
MKRTICLLLGLGLAVVAVAGQPLMRERAVMDSLRAVNPRFRATWLRDRGLQTAGCATTDSEGLRVVGRWSFGPSYDVDCRMTPAETLIVLGRGSGVSLLRFSRSDSAEFQLLSDINSAGLISRVRLADTLLLVGTGAGVETYSTSDARSPNLLSTLLTPLNDFAIRESLLYVMGYDDSFKIYSMADPDNPRRLGACRDSGGPVSLAGNTAFVGDRWGLYAIDVSNPANPHRVGSWGTFIISVVARGNICCVTEYDPDSVLFYLLDVTDPAGMYPLSSLRGAGGDALHMDGQYVYTAGGYGFQILDISDSLNAEIVGSCPLSVYKDGVWGKAGCDRAFVANEINGLAVMDDGDISHPLIDTTLLGAGSALDLEVRGSRCYVADEGGGMKLLDVADPTTPHTLGELDTIGGAEGCYSVVATDSFAFMGWFNTPFFRVADISEPTRPAFVGSCDPFEFAQDIVLRDTLAFCAENYKFEVVNVARPRAPVVVGTCGLPDHTYEMDMKDTLAFVANGIAGLQIVNVARPDFPVIVGSIAFPNPAVGVAVRDSFAYVGANHLRVVNVARPSAPFIVDSVLLTVYGRTVAAADTMLYVGTCLGYAGDLRAFSIADPASPRLVGFYGTPIGVNRVVYATPYVYAACSDAGIVLVETTATGVLEPEAERWSEPAMGVEPNPARDFVKVRLSELPAGGISLHLFDVTGREVLDQAIREEVHGITLDLTDLRPGLYFVRVETRKGVRENKLVKM